MPDKLTPESLPNIHKFGIFLLGNVAAFGASMLVEKGYIKGLTAIRARKVTNA